MEDLSLRSFAFQQRVADCRTLYNSYQGRHHDDIQTEMRAFGHERWNKRCLYADRGAKGKRIAGWPERFGFKSVPPAVAGGLTLDIDNSYPKPTPPASTGGPLTPAICPPAHAGGSDFLAWLRSISPEMTWDWKYQSHIIDRLKLVFEGKLKRLMIFVPPRHGKSELVTVRFSAWCLRNRPKMNIIIGSYNQKLANRFSRKIRHIHAHAEAVERLRDEGGGMNEEFAIHDKKICAKCIERSRQCPLDRNADALVRSSTAETRRRGEEETDLPQPALRLSASAVNPQLRPKQTDAEWETTGGGGVRAVGVGAGITGFGADLIIIDDPVKSRAEAESRTMRDNLSDWFNDDLYTRLEPEGSIILIQTRWHEDDLAGRLLREIAEDPDAEKWEVIELPAIAEPGPSAECRVQNAELSGQSGPPAVAGGLTPDIDRFGGAIPPEKKATLFYTVRGQRIPIRTIGKPKEPTAPSSPHPIS
ncbi:MAG: terminase family protein, partial [Pyrinomonadaceae bacterium]